MQAEISPFPKTPSKAAPSGEPATSEAGPEPPDPHSPARQEAASTLSLIKGNAKFRKVKERMS